MCPFVTLHVSECFPLPDVMVASLAIQKDHGLQRDASGICLSDTFLPFSIVSGKLCGCAQSAPWPHVNTRVMDPFLFSLPSMVPA